jgi:hypothetical protein
MELLLTPMLGSVIWIGGGAGLIILILIIILLVR